MAYVSLYRKYRPQTFADVVGQEHITTTLQNAVRSGRIASGYLFCGTRGTAKTTCARILAKALNCIGKDRQRDVPSPEPCGVCGPCIAIAESRFVDVIEMDAASHRGIDDMRDIVSNIKFPPMEGRYKVYIIDEAHQLTSDAKDAFLKTLEEPPDRVTFIMATTEPERMPITIRSRSQVFEFKRGSVAQISSRLNEVLHSENVPAEPGAVTLVARAAEGSYRDSLSLLEQVLSYQRDHVTAQDVTLVLGMVDDDLLNRVVEMIAVSDAPGAFALASHVLSEGKDVRQFLKGLSARLRDLLFLSVGAALTEAGEFTDTALLRDQAARFSPPALLHALEVLTEAERELKWNQQQRLLLEMTLLKLMRLPSSPSVAALTAPLPAPTQKEPVQPTLIAPKLVLETVPEIAPPLMLIDTDDDEEFDADSDLSDDEPDLVMLDDQDAPPVANDTEPALPSLLVTSTEEHAEADSLLQIQHVAAEEAPAPLFPPKPAAPEATPDASPELARIQREWPRVVKRMESRSASGVPVVRDAKPISLTGRTITLEFSMSVFVDKLEKSENKERARSLVEEIINKVLETEATPYRIKAVLKGENLPAKVALSAAPRVRETPPVAAPEPTPLLDEVLNIFGGRILE